MHSTAKKIPHLHECHENNYPTRRMTKSINEVISDIIQFGRTTSRLRALEVVKAKTCEWPSSSDDYCRLISGLCECVRTSSQQTLATSLGTLDFVVDDFSKALSSTLSFEERETLPPFQGTTKAVQLVVWVLTDAQSSLSESEGALEYACKLTKSLVASLLHVNNVGSSFTPGVAAALVYALLEFPATRPRHLDLIRGTVQTVVASFPFEFEVFGIEKMFESLLGYFSKSSRIPEMVFGFQLASILINRAPLAGREVLIINRPELSAGLLNQLVSVLTPAVTCYNSDRNGQLVSVGIETMRLVMTLLASSPAETGCSGDTSALQELERALIQNLSTDDSALDLIVDLKLARLWSYDAVYAETVEVGDQLTNVVITRWFDIQKWREEYWVESKLIELIFEHRFYLSASAVVGKIELPLVKGMEAMTVKIFTDEKFWIPFFENNKVANKETLSLATKVVFLQNKTVSSVVRERFGGWLMASDSATAKLVGELSVVLRFKSATILRNLCEYLPIKTLTNILLSVMGHSCLTESENQVDELTLFRNSLALRPIEQEISVGPPKPVPRTPLGKSFKFVEKMLKDALDYCPRLVGIYVMLGTMDLSVVKCDSCLLTLALETVSKSGPSQALAELKYLLNHEISVELPLCGCELHRDSTGEPRSVLSQSAGRIGSSNFSRPSLVSQLEKLGADEQLEVARSVGTVDICKHLASKVRFRKNNSGLLRKLGTLVSCIDVHNQDEFLLSFLENGYCALVNAHALVPSLSIAAREHLIRSEIGTDLPGTALRLSLSSCLVSEHRIKEAGGLLAPVLAEGTYALYAIDYFRMRFKNYEIRNLICVALVSAIPMGIPDELLMVISEELELVHFSNGLKSLLLSDENMGEPNNSSIGEIAAGLISGKRIHSISVSPSDVIVCAMEILTVIPKCSADQVLLNARNSCLRSIMDRKYFLQYLRSRFSNLWEPTTEERADKKSKIGKIDLCDLQFECDRSMQNAPIESLAKSFLFAIVFPEAPVWVTYCLQNLVGPGHLPLISLLGSQLGAEFSPDPIDTRLLLEKPPFIPSYPLSAVCELVENVLEIVFPTNIFLKIYISQNENLAANILPFLFLLISVSLESTVREKSIHTINEFIRNYPTTTSAIVNAISVGKLFEFKWRKKNAWPSPASVLFALTNDLDLEKLAKNCLEVSKPVEAYFIASSIFQAENSTAPTTLANLFEEPQGTLPIVLEALDKMGVRIYSLNVSLHPSIRGLVARLRNDSAALLHEDNISDFSAGLNLMGLGSSNDDLSDWSALLKSSGTEIGKSQETNMEINAQNCVEFIKSNLASGKNISTIIELLKNNTLFPPSALDDRAELFSQVAKIVRKQGRFHKSRIICDLGISLCPTAEIYYTLAKSLFGTGQYLEAANLMSALATTGLPANNSDLAVSVLSRSAEWTGQLRLGTVDHIRERFLQAIQASKSDFKLEIKAKIRFIKALQNNAMDKQLLIEEFNLLCEILASGLIVCSSKSGWLASRLLTLWFGNPGTCSPIIAKFRTQLAACPALLPLFYQTASRLGGGGCDNGEFKKEIFLFVFETSRLNLDTCLPIVLQLRKCFNGVGKNLARSSSAKAVKLEEDRAKQAELVIERLRSSSNEAQTHIVDGYTNAFKFYFNLAMLKVVPTNTSRAVSEIEGYPEFAKSILKKSAPILTGKGTIRSVEPEYAIADSGKSLPKILTVVDSTGLRHKQIVKGNDDLRNDAVLQQLFSLLASSMIRSYKVVPISACAGIAEWVQNTVTLGSFLVGHPDESQGAHCRYHPSDLPPATVKAKMVHARQQTRDLLASYNSCIAKFKPCMRFFFYEHFNSPLRWFEAQSKFSNSVAATSVVGYIVGLGDRHPNNILIDTSTGEVVHIDYGICFDAGKLLKIPEIVPFRLTRDMVDGLGSLGAQGPFAKTCEDILTSLKKNSGVVTAVVEVFVVDPLFNWAVASLGSDNAQEALQGVKRKLQGFLDSSDLMQLTPSAQIDRLIRSATDPRNLSQMFAGWQPWL
jgi:ataxia telangiectasia mutated family protein